LAQETVGNFVMIIDPDRCPPLDTDVSTLPSLVLGTIQSAPSKVSFGRYWLTCANLYWKTLVIIFTPLLLCFLLFLAPDATVMFEDIPEGKRNDLPDNLGPAFRCLFVLLLMAIYWSTMALPLPITALIPVFLMPVLGIHDTDSMARELLQNATMMFWCGLAFAIALEESGAHIRVALRVVLTLGTKSVSRIFIGLMSVTAFMSFWISNTACTAMMIPIVDAISDALPSKTRADAIHLRNVLLICIAYASSIGGAGVEIGSPPNLVPQIELNALMPDAHGKPQPNGKLTFVTYMAYGVPLTIVNIILSWLWISFITRHVRLENTEYSDTKRNLTKDIPMEDAEKGESDEVSTSKEDAVEKLLRKKYNDLGGIKTSEWSIFILFLLLVSLWIFSDPKFTKDFPGWAVVIREGWGTRNMPVGIGDLNEWNGYKIQSASPAVFVLILLFTLPQKYTFWPFQSMHKPAVSQPALLTWQKIHQKLPFQVIVLLGGGFALSEGIKRSGLGFVIALKLKQVLVGAYSGGITVVAQIVALIMTQVVSNSATSSILVPVFGQYAKTIDVNPILFMLPVGMVSNFAFTLPVGTPPNALVFEASKHTMPIGALCKIGLGLIVIHLCTMNLFINTLGLLLFDVYGGCKGVFTMC